jgi:hypothetical protein
VPATVVTAQPPGEAVGERVGVVVGVVETVVVGVAEGEAPGLSVGEGVGEAVGVGQATRRTTFPPWSAVKSVEDAALKATPAGERKLAA